MFLFQQTIEFQKRLTEVGVNPDRQNLYKCVYVCVLKNDTIFKLQLFRTETFPKRRYRTFILFYLSYWYEGIKSQFMFSFFKLTFLHITVMNQVEKQPPPKRSSSSYLIFAGSCYMFKSATESTLFAFVSQTQYISIASSRLSVNWIELLLPLSPSQLDLI